MGYIFKIDLKWRLKDSLGIFKENPVRYTSNSVPAETLEDAFEKLKGTFSFSTLEILEVKAGIFDYMEPIFRRHLGCVGNELVKRENEKLMQILLGNS